MPAAGKPSRPEERPGKVPRADETVPGASKPTQPDEQPKGPGKPDERPAAGKPSRPEDKPERFDDKPKRGDQTPDSLEEDDVQPEKLPNYILSKIPLKEQCICELCTCG